MTYTRLGNVHTIGGSPVPILVPVAGAASFTLTLVAFPLIAGLFSFWTTWLTFALLAFGCVRHLLKPRWTGKRPTSLKWSVAIDA